MRLCRGVPGEGGAGGGEGPGAGGGDGGAGDLGGALIGVCLDLFALSLALAIARF